MEARNDSALPTEPRRRSCPVVLAIVMVLGSCLSSSRADEPAPKVGSRPIGSPWPSAIILEPPLNRDALLAKLRRPDLVIWDGDAFDRWVQTGGEWPGVADRTGPAVVGSVAVSVRPEATGGVARLVVRYRITLGGDGTATVPIALDGLTLGRVAEGGRDLAATSLGDGRGWGVELTGKGEHAVEVETRVRSRPRPDLGQVLDLAIPPAAATEVELVTLRPLMVARAGPEEALAIVASGGGSRAVGHLSPRPRLELTWGMEEPGGDGPPAMLAARGELAVTARPDAIETREVWTVASLRGATRQVALQLRPDEVVLDLQVDRREVVVDRRPGGEGKPDTLVVPLVEPLAVAGAGEEPRSVTIALATRLPRPPSDPAGDPARFALVGHPIVGARSQTGVIGVAQSDSTTIWPVEGRGVRRVDPRTDLPEGFRGRAEAWLGFEFAEQPFDLGVQVEAVAPQFEVNARSTVALKAERAEVTTTLVGRVWAGRLFDIRVLAPPGLTFEPTDPSPAAPTIRSERKRLRPSDPAVSSAEILIATFARPVVAGDTFAVTLRGSARLAATGPASAGLFSPLGSTLSTTEVALVPGRNRRFDLTEGDAPRFVRLDPGAAPAGWTWPRGLEPDLASAATWLRADQDEAVIPVRIAACPRVVRHRSTSTVALDREGADVVAELTGEVANGSARSVDLALPPEASDRWVAEAGEGLEREALDPDPSTGWRRYRLKLAEATDAYQIRIRYRLVYSPGLGGDPNRRTLRVQPIQVPDGTSTGQAIRLAAESDVAIAAEAPGWTDRRSPVEDRTDPAPQVRQTFEHPGDSIPGPIEVVATLGQLAEVPTLVASRLWLRSAQMPGGELATTAQYRLETHARTVALRLPAGSRWIRGEAGGVEISAADVEHIGPDTYRITLPSAVGVGPVPLRVDSILDRPPGDGAWLAPELVDGVVQQTAWELSLLGTRAGVGVPEGWADENAWYRDTFLWKRRPRREEADLARWLTDGVPRPAGTVLPGAATNPAPSDASHWSGDFGSGTHSYLFSRSGPPGSLRFATWARSTLVLLCSGPVLLVGLLILARRPPPRWVAAGGLGLGFLWVATVEPNSGLLVAESSSVGFVLAGIAAVINISLERRGRSAVGTPAPVEDTSAWGAEPATPSSGRPSAGSDERTVIHAIRPAVGGSTGAYPNPLLVELEPAASTPPSEPEPEVEPS